MDNILNTELNTELNSHILTQQICRAAARFNTADHKIFDHTIFALCGDGCIQEGVSGEAACFAAHEKLDNLVVLLDSNDVTLDKMAEYTQSEDVGMRYEAYGWDVETIDGHDLVAVDKAIGHAKTNRNGKPTLIICRTIIGKGMPETEVSERGGGGGGGEENEHTSTSTI